MTQSNAPAAGSGSSAAPNSNVESRAAALVNPASGLANDYLNLFNEIVMLIEQLPEMPELIDDLLAWRPTTYLDYFNRSILPGRHSALDAYAELDLSFRQKFETIVAELDRIATASVALIRRHLRKKGVAEPGVLTELCAKAGAALRNVLERASTTVNHGIAEADENAQRRADRLLAVRLHVSDDLQRLIAGQAAGSSE
jgi:hypothetical protein